VTAKPSISPTTELRRPLLDRISVPRAMSTFDHNIRPRRNR
jgi:hypothetical protein